MTSIAGAPIVPNARWLIRCACGFSYNTADGETAPEAISAFVAEHKHVCASTSFTAEKYPKEG